jgi:hypothetical protein
MPPIVVGDPNRQIPSLPPLSPLGNQQNSNYPPNTAYPPSPIPSANFPQYCGTVNYVTTQINLLIPVPLQEGSQLNIWAATYQPGRPYNVLFWNNEITIRPVPDNVYLCEIEVFQTPAQFMNVTDNHLSTENTEIGLRKGVDIVPNKRKRKRVKRKPRAPASIRTERRIIDAIQGEDVWAAHCNSVCISVKLNHPTYVIDGDDGSRLQIVVRRGYLSRIRWLYDSSYGSR